MPSLRLVRYDSTGFESELSEVELLSEGAVVATFSDACFLLKRGSFAALEPRWRRGWAGFVALFSALAADCLLLVSASGFADSFFGVSKVLSTAFGASAFTGCDAAVGSLFVVCGAGLDDGDLSSAALASLFALFEAGDSAALGALDVIALSALVSLAPLLACASAALVSAALVSAGLVSAGLVSAALASVLSAT